jgi:pimeloyl-ACP methyl ester carboxylesterase
MLAHLRAWSRRVMIVESAGHGLSEPARCAYTTTRHLESITAVLDQLLDEPALIVGNSPAARPRFATRAFDRSAYEQCF